MIIKGDNLEELKKLPDETVDLVYLDPPFNSNRDYGAFTDTWNEDDFIDDPSLQVLFDLVDQVDGEKMKFYLSFIVVRLKEIRRIMKNDASIYLHCDDSANSYLRILMNAIFGKNNYRNTIVWKRMDNAKNNIKNWGRVVDIILYYQKKKNKFNVQYWPLSPVTLKQYKYVDKIGSHAQHTTKNFSDPKLYGLSDPSGPEDPKEKYKHLGDTYKVMQWDIQKPNYGEKYALTLNVNGNSLDNNGKFYDLGYGERMPKRGYRFKKEKMEELIKQGLIIIRPGKVPMIKKYLKDSKGVCMSNLWVDIRNLKGNSKEWVEYPTQKPIALLERIIKASSNEGDVVMDPFCGSGTTLVAAKNLNRKYIGIDQNETAIKITKERLNVSNN